MSVCSRKRLQCCMMVIIALSLPAIMISRTGQMENTTINVSGNVIGSFENKQGDKNINYIYVTDDEIALPSEFEKSLKSINEDKMHHSSDNLHIHDKNIVSAKNHTLPANFTISDEVTSFSETELRLQLKMADKKTPTIPRIIHQYWDNYDPVPQLYINYIKSVIKHHPNWQYWFWTNADVDLYLRTRHPEFYHNVFMHYTLAISRADVMRYFVLYDFGGVYLDLDIEVLKPLDVWTLISPCVLSHENYEHSYILHSRNSANVINAAMACRPKHPLFKMIIDNLEKYYIKYGDDILYSTGPFFMDEIYHKYKQQIKSSSGNGEKDDVVTIIEPKYWFPTYDKTHMRKMSAYCSSNFFIKGRLKRSKSPRLGKILEYICKKHLKKKNHNDPGKAAYLDHHWVHTNTQAKQFKTKHTGSVFTVAPKLVNVSAIL